MIYLGNGIYSDSGMDTLVHYGRLGMKWGQHIFGKEVQGTNGYVRKRRTKWGTKYSIRGKYPDYYLRTIMKDDANGDRDGYIDHPGNLIYHFYDNGRVGFKGKNKPLLSAASTNGKTEYVYHGGNLGDASKFFKQCFKNPPTVKEVFGLGTAFQADAWDKVYDWYESDIKSKKIKAYIKKNGQPDGSDYLRSTPRTQGIAKIILEEFGYTNPSKDVIDAVAESIVWD